VLCQARPGSITVMKNEKASERAAALVHEAVDVLQRADHAPDSPVNTFQPAEQRRKLRRGAKRLRQGKAQPRYGNLHTSEELADIYERTVQRDGILEQAGAELRRISLEIRRVVEQEGAAAARTFNAMFLEAEEAAMLDGPDSESAQRYRRMRFLISVGARREFEKRRQTGSPYPRVIPFLTKDPRIELRYELAAAEILASPPPSGEAVIAIPAEDSESGRGRVLMRIGVGNASWIGSFERGHMDASTIFMMPDGKHLFVSAEGAGYVIDVKSRTLVEEIGTEVAGVMRDDPMTVFVVVHNSLSLEAFGRTGRLWKTDPIGCGGFRRMAITDTRLVGEARQPYSRGWAGFSVKLATGEVRFGDGR
jgi:hypothetical protein